MDIVGIATSLLVGILSLFLAISSSAERFILASLEPLGYERPFVTYEAPAPTDGHQVSNGAIDEQLEVSQLPSSFEREQQVYGGAIPSILLTSPGPERQSIVLSPSESAVAGTSTEILTSEGEIPVFNPSITPSEALVNVFCTLRSKGEVRATTGSGVFIDPRGVVLTNAHVAQFLLLSEKTDERTTRCTIRMGSPATSQYIAELLYISPLWVSENAQELKNDVPSGTGERDYALLYITDALEGTLPDAFPALPIDTTPLGNRAKNQAVIAAGFPAEVIKTDGPRAPLIPTIATTTITELFTYTEKKVDLIGIAPSAVGEGGSSGGPIISLNNVVIGIITTRGDVKKEGERSLRAITLAYIDRTIKEEMGIGLRDYLKNRLPERARIFRTTMTPLLSRIVNNALTD